MRDMNEHETAQPPSPVNVNNNNDQETSQPPSPVPEQPVAAQNKGGLFSWFGFK